MSSLYSFYVNLLSYSCKDFLLVYRFLFHYVDGFLCCTKAFYIVPLNTFSLLLPLLLMSDPVNRCQDQSLELIPYVFSGSVMVPSVIFKTIPF